MIDNIQKDIEDGTSDMLDLACQPAYSFSGEQNNNDIQILSKSGVVTKRTQLPSSHHQVKEMNDMESYMNKLDDRLFPEHMLYCEGLEKPVLRGVFHLFFSIFLLYGLFHMYYDSNGNPYAQFSSFIFVLGNLYCVGTSALYHLGKWSVNTEILLQKLDHCGIAVYAAGVNFPTAFLLCTPPIGALLIISTILACSWVCWHIFNNRPAVWRFVIVCLVFILYLPFFYSTMTNFELSCAAANSVIEGLGMMIFVMRKPDPWPRVFGYHEIFHFMTVVAMTIVFVCNWSIIHRVCNPYARHTDVVEILWQLVRSRVEI